MKLSKLQRTKNAAKKARGELKDARIRAPIEGAVGGAILAFIDSRFEAVSLGGFDLEPSLVAAIGLTVGAFATKNHDLANIAAGANGAAVYALVDSKLS